MVEACMKLFPRPPERSTFTMRAGTLGIARDLRRSILRSPLDPLRLVLLDSAAVSLVRGDATGPSSAELWIEMGGSHRVMERCEGELAKLGSAVGAPLARQKAAEAAWELIANPAMGLEKKCRHVTVLKAALPLVASEEFLSRAHQEAEAERIALACFAQVGVGIVHLCLLPESLSPALEGLVVRLRKAAEDLGGRLIIEHCPVDLKNRVDVWGSTGDDVEAMRKMKSAWDPKGILAPGRFLGGI
jgi:glycolate oxidase FAD binding subunit